MTRHFTTDIETAAAIKFYDDNYDIAAQYFLSRGNKIYLGSKSNRRCRFCGHAKPDVTFKSEAHAVPECLGNRTLRSWYECDSCNQLFGEGIENDFGNWSIPMRTLARIRGKKHFPTIRPYGDGGWRLEASISGLEFKGNEDDLPITIDEENKLLTITLTRGNYTPIAVMKALVKMGLTILREEEMPNFQQALAWIRERNHAAVARSGVRVMHTFFPGPQPNNLIVLLAHRRKHDGLDVPYASFVLSYANEMLQVFLPSPERDENRGPLQLFRFPGLPEIKGDEHGPSETYELDMSGTSVVKGQVCQASIRFDGQMRRQQGWPPGEGDKPRP